MADKKKQLHDLTSAELTGRLEDARDEYRKLRFRFASGELTDHSRLSHIRREVARLMTILHERELKETEGEA